mmetsp:Transcript_9162/g.11462  ORF Transcript_9162/g.11462 Transcript_9162/m.11462 type:complete len:107 (+) Transcript_9162:64-384(+)
MSSTTSFVAQIMAPGGGILLIPFTRAVVCCLFITTSTVFVLGVARIHMFILSVLSVGFYIALGIFQKEYKKAFAEPPSGPGSSGNGVGTSKVTKRTRPVSKAKRED